MSDTTERALDTACEKLHSRFLNLVAALSTTNPRLDHPRKIEQALAEIVDATGEYTKSWRGHFGEWNYSGLNLPTAKAGGFWG